MNLKTFAALAVTLVLFPIGASAAVDRAMVEAIGFGNDPGQMNVCAHYMDGATQASSYCSSFDIGAASTTSAIITEAVAAVNDRASFMGYTLTNGIIWPWMNQTDIQALIDAKQRVSSNLSLTLQTSTGAVGTQVSATTGGWVVVSGQVTTTASIAGNAAGDIIVEVAPTNSATAGDWVEWGRIGNSQALSLAITLQSVQVTKSSVSAYVPAGYYIKARTSGSGTVSYQLNTVKKVL